MKRRCPNGTRKNKYTGKCEEKKLKKNTSNKQPISKKQSKMYECVEYIHGPGIFNKPGEVHKYRDLKVYHKWTFTLDDVYENKVPKDKVLYLWTRKNAQRPLVHKYFVSKAGMDRYLKENQQLGKIGQDFYYEILRYSHNDRLSYGPDDPPRPVKVIEYSVRYDGDDEEVYEEVH
jgi:hypothetical protein